MVTGKPKGFKPSRRLYKLDFAETDLEGLEVTARGASMGEIISMMETADDLSAVAELDETADAGKIAAQLREMVAPFARKLVAWNLLGDDDEPVPASLDGLLTQDLDFVIRLITAYGQAMTQAPPPLPGASPSGAISREEQTMLAALSSSPGS